MGCHLLEGVARREDLGQQEVEQSPQLGERVLQRRAREQHAVLVRASAWVRVRVRVRARVRVWVRVWGLGFGVRGRVRVRVRVRVRDS